MRHRNTLKLSQSVALTMMILLSTTAAGAQTRAAEREPATTLILPTAALAGSALFDIHTTRQAFERGCVQGNPLLGTHPSTAKLLAAKASTTGFGFVAMLIAHKTGHPRLARVFGYSASSAGILAGALNTANRCQR